MINLSKWSREYFCFYLVRIQKKFENRDDGCNLDKYQKYFK
jgi:hypothetical protein